MYLITLFYEPVDGNIRRIVSSGQRNVHSLPPCLEYCRRIVLHFMAFEGRISFAMK